MKVLAFAKSKKFKDGLTGNQAKAFSDATVLTTQDDDVKEAYKLNDRAYQFLILSCSDIAFGLVNMAKTEELKDGDARIAWKNLLDWYAPQGSTNLIHLTGELKICVLDNSRSDPDLWFIKIEDIRHRLRRLMLSTPRKTTRLLLTLSTSYQTSIWNSSLWSKVF